jgi:hypothetical protein
MNTTFYHAMAFAGWLINIAGHLMVQYQNPYAYYIQGFSEGMPSVRVSTWDHHLDVNNYQKPQSKT